jgi:hypothetical protein
MALFNTLYARPKLPDERMQKILDDQEILWAEE